MNILLVNHGSADDWGGGDGVQIRETAKRLAKRGHRVVSVNTDTPDPSGFDLVHIFNSRVFDSFASQVSCCHRASVPIVVSPIWVSIGRALWGSRATAALLQQALQDGHYAVEGHLNQLRERQISVGLPDGKVIQSHGLTEHGQGGLRNLLPLLNQASGLLPNSWLELQSLRSDLHWTGSTFSVAHYGADPSIFLDADPSLFQEETGIKGQFVLQAGRIEPAKNQAMLCWALRNTNIQIVLIGSSSNWPSYSTLCREISGKRLTIIDHLPQRLLASAYAAASVHVLPSWMETCGLVSLEAALAGTPVVASTFGHELEYLKSDALYCDPADPSTIASSVEMALSLTKTDYKVNNLKKRVLEEFNWERTAETTEQFYRRVISGTF